MHIVTYEMSKSRVESYLSDTHKQTFPQPQLRLSFSRHFGHITLASSSAEQLSSSDRSPHLSSKLHFSKLGIHFPFAHLKYFSPQGASRSKDSLLERAHLYLKFESSTSSLFQT